MDINSIESEVGNVLTAARLAIRDALLAEVATNMQHGVSTEKCREVLAQHALTSTATWSGGALSPANIERALRREVALELACYHDLHHLSFPYRRAA